MQKMEGKGKNLDGKFQKGRGNQKDRTKFIKSGVPNYVVKYRFE